MGPGLAFAQSAPIRIGHQADMGWMTGHGITQPGYRGELSREDWKLRKHVAHEIGANFFLDCLTFHKSDQQRLLDTVSTYYDGASAAKKFG